MKLFKGWKKVLAFTFALTLVAVPLTANSHGFVKGSTPVVASAAETAEEPAAVPDTIERDGVTYFNVNSQNFNSTKKFFLDMFNTKREINVGYHHLNVSIGDQWVRLATYLADAMQKPIPGVPEADDLAGYIGKYFEISDAKWVNDSNYTYGGYVESTLSSSTSYYEVRKYVVRFYDFSLVALMPENTGKNYVSTTIESSESRPVYASSVKNNSSTPTSSQQSLSFSTSASLSNSISGSENYSYSEGIESKQKVDFLVMDAEFSEKFSATQAFQKGWQTGESLSDSVSSSTSVSVNLPPYTNVMLSQGSDSTVITTKYNCPVGLKYKADVLVDNGYDGLQPVAQFGIGNGDARKDLYQRAIIDGDQNLDPQIDWRRRMDKFWELSVLAKSIPMSAYGATMIQKKDVTTTTIEGLAPIYPLASVESAKQELTLNVGETAYTNDIDLKGLNMYGADYYGFNPSYGHWIVTDKNGNEFENAPVILNTNSVSKKTAINTLSAGTCYLKYVIDENSYATAENISTYTKNSDLSATAMIKVTVNEDENATIKPKVTVKQSFEDRARVLGREHYNLDDYFTVEFKDRTGKEIDYVWEAQERKKKGVTFDEDNRIYFTKNGIFHVRVIDPESGIYSDWFEITGMIQAGDEDPYEITEPDELIFDADENTSFVISCSYTGLVGAEPDMLEGEPAIELHDENDEPVYTHGRLQFDAYDKSNKEMNIAYSWEAQEKEGITVTEDGKVSFTLPGTYHIRVKSGEYASNWFVIEAKNTSEEYSTVWFIDADGSLIDKHFKPWGSELTPPDAPEYEGLIFDGWEPEVPTTMPADDMTITAKWKLDESVERVLINATIKGNGQIASSNDGSEPVFDDEYPYQNCVHNAVKDTTVKLTAKADEGWTFKEWKNKATRETYSTNAAIAVKADEDLELVAVFVEDNAVEHKITDDQLEIWTEKDYKDKTGTAARAEITGWTDDEYEITLTDEEGKVLDTYTVNPDTGIGTNGDGKEVNLPQTGMSGVHKTIAGLAALMTFTGVALVKKSRREDED